MRGGLYDQPPGGVWDADALRGRWPEWDFATDLYKVTAVLRGPGPQVSATPEPVSPRVMANVLLGWRVQQDTAGCRTQRHSRTC